MAHEIYGCVLSIEFLNKRKSINDLNLIISIFTEALRLNPTRNTPKGYIRSLLESYYLIFSHKRFQWLKAILKKLTLFIVPLEILALYSYQNYGLRFFPTGIFAIVTVVSMLQILNLTQYHIRVHKSPYRKFNTSYTTINVFWYSFGSVFTIGVLWSSIQSYIKNILLFFLGILSIFYIIFIFYDLYFSLVRNKLKDEEIRISGAKKLTQNCQLN
jgi:hypothetical protein